MPSTITNTQTYAVPSGVQFDPNTGDTISRIRSEPIRVVTSTPMRSSAEHDRIYNTYGWLRSDGTVTFSNSVIESYRKHGVFSGRLGEIKEEIDKEIDAQNGISNNGGSVSLKKLNELRDEFNRIEKEKYTLYEEEFYIVFEDGKYKAKKPSMRTFSEITVRGSIRANRVAEMLNIGLSHYASTYGGKVDERS